MTARFATDVLWVIWIVSWLLAAFWADRAAKRPAATDEILYRVVTVIGGGMLFAFRGRFPFEIRLWQVDETLAWALFGLSFAGFVFCWWARIYLGKLWSGWVSRKADHRIIDTGPYAVVRHPIYTGFILALFAMAAMKATVLAFAGAAVMTFGFFIKARLEERFLRTELGADGYDAYRRRVPMLLPFGPKAA